jgi:hypothetical protein
MYVRYVLKMLEDFKISYALKNYLGLFYKTNIFLICYIEEFLIYNECIVNVGFIEFLLES